MENVDINPEPAWESDDAVALRNFLRSKSGRRLLARIAFRKPGYPPGYDTNARLVVGAVIEGYDLSVATILGSMTASGEAPEEFAENYPDLEDDDAWRGIELAEQTIGINETE